MPRITDVQFDISLEVGYLGEDRFLEYISNKFWLECEDVSQDKEYQHKDIDFLITNTVTGKKTTVELKTDTYTTGNFFIEEYTHKESNTYGWLYKSQADVLVYYFVTGTVHPVTVLLSSGVITSKDNWELLNIKNNWKIAA